MSNSKIARRVGFGCGVGAQLADQRALGHLLEAQRGDDLVDVGFLVDDRLPVDLADGTDQAFLVQRRIVGAVEFLQLALSRSVKRGSKRRPNQCRMAKLALLTLCMSPVIAVGTMSDVLRYQMSNT